MTPTTRLVIAGLAALCVAGPAFGQNAPKSNHNPEALRKAAFNVDKFVAGLYKRKKLSVPDVVDDAMSITNGGSSPAGVAKAIGLVPIHG